MSETPEPPITPDASDAPPVPPPAEPPAEPIPAPAEGSPPAAAAAPGTDQAKEVYGAVMADQNLKIGAGGFIAFFIGLLFNWFSVSVGGFTASTSGFSTDRGKAIFVLVIAAVVLMYLKKTLAALITGGIAAAWTLYTVFDIGIGNTGLGMWISLIGAAALAYAAYSQHSQAGS